MTKTLIAIMREEAKRLMTICVKELTNTLLFSSEDGNTVGTATITVGRYEIKNVTVAILKDDNAFQVIDGRQINPYFTIKILTKKEYNEALAKLEEKNKQSLREKACDAYFKEVK